MEFITMIGLVAAMLSTISLLPQLLRVWKTKSVKDLSMGMCVIMCTSVVLWLMYGVLAADMPLMVSNTVVFAQTVAILGFKAKYQPREGDRFLTIASKLKLRTNKKNVDKQDDVANTGIPLLL